MFERWERCEATVVARSQRSVEGDEPGYDFLLDVHPLGTPMVRLTASGGVAGAPAVGDVVAVFYDDETKQVAFNVAAADALGGFTGRSAELLAAYTPPGGLSADPGERLAKLVALNAQGFLTDDEYQVQRQRVIDTI